MATKFPEFFAALTRPIDTKYVKERSQGGRKFNYVTARVVMNRLDEVCGPEGWEDEYFPSENSVLCRLTITLPDGSKLTKNGTGGYAGMSDEGDDCKSGASDSLKLAAAKFGIARELYNDGTVDYVGIIADKDDHTPESLKSHLDGVAADAKAAFLDFCKKGEKKPPKDLPFTGDEIRSRLAAVGKLKGFVIAAEQDLLSFFNSRARLASTLVTEVVNGLKKEAVAALDKNPPAK